MNLRPEAVNPRVFGKSLQLHQPQLHKAVSYPVLGTAWLQGPACNHTEYPEVRTFEIATDDKKDRGLQRNS